MALNNGIVGYRIWGVDNVVYGPVELPVLVEWIQEERVMADTWIFCEQADTWRKAAQISELKMFFARRSTGSTAGHTSAFSPLIPGVKAGVLRRIKSLADLSDQQLGLFAQMMEIQEVRQWTEIVKQGSTGDSMYFVLEGEVRVRLMINEKESILTTLGPGEFFGETSLFDQGPRSADVVANKDSVLLRISGRNFERLVNETPDIAAPFLLALGKSLVARIRADNKRFRDQITFARAAR